MLTANVKTYGAVGNGSTNDTDAVRAAITAVANAGGGVVFFPAGTYKVGHLTLAHPNIELRGVGPRYNNTNGSILLYYGTALYGNNHLVTVSAGNCGLRGLVLDGGGSALRSPTHITPTAGDGASCLSVGGERFTASHCRFENAYNKQVVVNGVRFIRFRYCAFDAKADAVGNADGLHLYGGTTPCTDIEVSRCQFYRHWRAGVYCDVDVRRVRIVDCVFENAELTETLVQSGEQSGCYLPAETAAPKSPPSAAAIRMQGYGDDLVVRRCTTSRYYAAVRLMAGVKRVRIEQNRFLAASNAGVMIGGERIPTWNLVSTEARFKCIKEVEGTLAVIAADVQIIDNLIQFQSNASSPVELVEQNGASGAVVIVGFGPDTTQGHPEVLGYVGRVTIDNFTVLPPTQAALSVRQLVLVAMRSDPQAAEKFSRLIIRNCETRAGVKQILRFINLGSAGGTGPTPEHLVVEGNRMAGLSETSPLTATKLVEVRNNFFSQYRVGGGSGARVFDAAAPAAVIRDNVFGTAGGQVANPAYQIAVTNITDSGNLASAI